LLCSITASISAIDSDKARHRFRQRRQLRPVEALAAGLTTPTARLDPAEALIE
jgi:hypothetical protein